jgi:hypothetical protein
MLFKKGSYQATNRPGMSSLQTTWESEEAASHFLTRSILKNIQVQSMTNIAPADVLFLKDKHTRNETKLAAMCFCLSNGPCDLYIAIKLLRFSMVFYTVKCQGLYATTVL